MLGHRDALAGAVDPGQLLGDLHRGEAVDVAGHRREVAGVGGLDPEEASGPSARGTGPARRAFAEPVRSIFPPGAEPRAASANPYWGQPHQKPRIMAVEEALETNRPV